MHSRGVRHGDVEPWHWYAKPGSDDVCVIDFSHAEVLQDEMERESYLSLEIAVVRELLGLPLGEGVSDPYVLDGKAVA